MSTTAYDEDKAMSLAAIADNLEALVYQLTRIADALEGWHADVEEEREVSGPDPDEIAAGVATFQRELNRNAPAIAAILDDAPPAK